MHQDENRDVTDTLNLALIASGCGSVRIEYKPRPLSDNRPCYIAGELAEWLEKRSIKQLHGAPGHP